MKAQTVLIAAVLALVGCASQKENPNASVAGNTATTCTGTYCETIIDADGDGIADVPTGTGSTPTTTGYDYGATASITLNGSALGRLFYNSQPRNPTNVRVNINLASNAESVIVSYVENGILKEASFGTKHPDQNYSNASFNGWVNQGGQQVWKGFFQDRFGAIVIVVDKYLSQGDGAPASILGGSIYFQNFQESAYQNPVQGNQKMCWEIYDGPYDCRTFIVGANNPNAYPQTPSTAGSVIMTSSLYPNNKGPRKSLNYEKLGDFAGVNRTAAGF